MNNEKIKQQFDGINIIKFLATLLVPSLHFFTLYNFVNQPYAGILMIFEESIRWISFSCIGLFIISTGFLQANKTPSKKYFINIFNYIFVFFIYCIITAYGEQHPIGFVNWVRMILYYFLQCPGYFWYMGFFIGFYIFIPFLNILLSQLNQTQFKQFLLALLLVISIPEFINWLPSIEPQWKYLYLPNYWKDFFPILYFSLGAYARKYEFKFSYIKIVLLLLLTSIGISTIDYLAVNGATPKFYGGGYGSIITVSISFYIFLLFYKVNLKKGLVSKCVKYFSSLSLNIYLGLAVSNILTSILIKSHFAQLITPFTFKLYFIEFPINFLISLGIAIPVNLFIKSILYLKHNTFAN